MCYYFFGDRMKNFYKIINEISEEEGIKCKYLSKNWVTMLEKQGKIKFICGYKFGFNDHALGEIIDDKYALYCVLKDNNIPVIKHKIVYNYSNKNEYAKNNNTYLEIKKYFYKNNENVVLKPNSGTCGNDVYHIKNESELKEKTSELLNRYFSISICPYYEISSEYRVIVLNDEAVLVYEKIRPIIYGDGKKSINELLRNFNPYYFNENIDIDSKILDINEKYEYSWKFNLSKGAICNLEIDVRIKNIIINLALLSSKKIGLRFGSVDIIHTKNDEYYVLEMNSGVMMDNFINMVPNGYNIAKSIYKKAIKALMK